MVKVSGKNSKKENYWEKRRGCSWEKWTKTDVKGIKIYEKLFTRREDTAIKIIGIKKESWIRIRR